MFIISDAHVNQALGNHEPFFDMLAALGKTDDDVVFLGDIFDLWICLPRYERAVHRRFLSWCAVEKRRRCIGYVEGNHEYFLARRRNHYFTWCTDGAFWRDASGTIFCHGDQINRLDHHYLWFRRAVKNDVFAKVLRWLPLGAGVVEEVKARLKHTNPLFRRYLPREHIDAFASARFNEGALRVFVGHFHRTYRYRDRQGRVLYAVPCWFDDQTITHFDTASGTVRCAAWPAFTG
jgi:UDP-2,3-diacylglucosamine pyrophosphatase LpxH